MQIINSENILKLLYFYNPWWTTNKVDVCFNKPIKRFSYYESIKLFLRNDIKRSVLLSGARRTGKTTIMYQIIAQLLDKGYSPKQILFISFEHPLLKLCSIENVFNIYRENICSEEIVFCFFDEIQYADDWNIWMKILYDNFPNIKIMATGSASPILNSKAKEESGLGRWKIILVPTLSFFEYCQLLEIKIPDIPSSIKPTQMYLYSEKEQLDIFMKLSFLQPHFLRYLLVGGFPELALSKDDLYAQRVLREDIVDKAIKRDLPAIFGTRNIGDVEKIFLYLCYNSSNIINIETITKEIGGISRTTVQNYINQLENANLIYISKPIDLTGKKNLKIKNKIYISDAAIRSAVLMNDDFINNPSELGFLVETAVYKHIKSFCYNEPCSVGYYRDGSRGKEIDIVVKGDKYSIYIEVKYREKSEVKENDGIVELYDGKKPNIVVTKNSNDFGIKMYKESKIYKIPAFAFLYLLGYIEYINNISNN